MPRKADHIRAEVPLYLISPVIGEEIKKTGDALDRIVVRRSDHHFYNISIRTRPVRRELRSRGP
jgi:hypothetical protein